MRARDASATLTAEQSAAADAGMKAMIPIGRPFLDYVLSALADAGFSDVCIVVGPEHQSIRQYYRATAPTSRIRIHFTVQTEARGTADAVLTTEEFAAGDPVVVLNADNYYPPATLALLRDAAAPATLAFRRHGLLRDGHIPAERIARYAILDVDGTGYLSRVVEKPDAETLAQAGDDPWVSMNCWLIDASIFQACRDVPPSPRGELELPLAMQFAIEQYRARVTAVRVDAGVLDLSHRSDVAAVAERLRGVEVRL